MISQKYSGLGNSVNFKNSDSRLCGLGPDVDSAVCVPNTLLLSLEQVFGRINSFECVDLHICGHESFA